MWRFWLADYTFQFSSASTVPFPSHPLAFYRHVLTSAAMKFYSHMISELHKFLILLCAQILINSGLSSDLSLFNRKHISYHISIGRVLYDQASLLPMENNEPLMAKEVSNCSPVQKDWKKFVHSHTTSRLVVYSIKSKFLSYRWATYSIEETPEFIILSIIKGVPRGGLGGLKPPPPGNFSEVLAKGKIQR